MTDFVSPKARSRKKTTLYFGALMNLIPSLFYLLSNLGKFILHIGLLNMCVFRENHRMDFICT
jgi:hypothetical protein